MSHSFLPVLSLESEGGIGCVSDEDKRTRQFLVEGFLSWPIDAFQRMRHLQPQIGCLSRCSFCSQSAGTSIWYLDKQQLANVFAAIKYVSLLHALSYENGRYLSLLNMQTALDSDGRFSKQFVMPNHGLLGYDRIEHRPGVLFCYLDNDISNYPYLDDFLKFSHEDLGIKIRISTVGYSRHSSNLQIMHTQIAKYLTPSLAGVRLSISSYAYGWHTRNEFYSNSEYVADIANFLKVYKPAFEALKLGSRTACVEFRFCPLLQIVEWQDNFRDGHHVIDVSPYFLVSKNAYQELPESKVLQNIKGRIKFDQSPHLYYMVRDVNLSSQAKEHILRDVMNGKFSEIGDVQLVPLRKMSNDDGIYYVVSAEAENNEIYTKQFYPQVGCRPKSGYIDSERYFLNALLSVGKLGSPHYNWSNVGEVLSCLKRKAEHFQVIDPFTSEYITNEILPLVGGYAKALKTSEFSANEFFNKKFTRDTGTICNLGRAYNSFKGLVSRPNLPLKPSDERAYGKNGSLAIEGSVWRLSVAPSIDLRDEKISGGDIGDIVDIFSTSRLRHESGERNMVTRVPNLVLERFDMAETSTERGQTGDRMWMSIPKLEKISLAALDKEYLIPGQRILYHK